MTTPTNPYLMEIEQEAPATQMLFDRLPRERLAWRPHPKSMSLGQLALHVATIPGTVAQLTQGSGVEAASLLAHAEPESVAEILNAWDGALSALREALKSAGDDGEPWSITKDGKAVLTMTKATARRLLMLNHWYHHRGQLTVYLRMLNVPLPAVYGASADENPFA